MVGGLRVCRDVDGLLDPTAVTGIEFPKGEVVMSLAKYWRPALVLAAGLVLLPTGFSLFKSDVRQQTTALPTDSVAAVATSDLNGWKTETFSSAALEQLKTLGKLIEQSDAIGTEQLSELATPSFSCDSLRPQKLEEVFTDAAVTVSRARKRTASADHSITGDVHTGIDGLRQALQSLTAPLAAGSDTHVAFKIYRVEVNSETAVTRADFECSGSTPDGLMQQNATWMCHWMFDADSDRTRLTRIELEDYEEVVRKASHDHLFSDCGQAVLGGENSVGEQLSRGVDYWKFRSQAELKVDPYGHHGLILGDVNGDGLEDVYVCQPAGLPNRLFVQQLDGTATEMSAAAGVDWLDRSFGSLLVDLDNDSDQDLAIVMDANLMLMANDGTGKFSERAIIYVKDDPYSLAAADYDNDGDLDLYLASYGNQMLGNNGPGYEPPFPYHDANNGSPNTLLRNDGDWRFTNVTQETGLDENNRRWSFAASWEDYDNDGDQDLYVANDFGRNNLYRNDGGRFTDVAAFAGVEDIAASMSVSWADYNNDGWMDLYVGNMFSSAGERIAYQRQFQSGAGEDVRQQFQRHARGNTLFENAGNGTFRDVSVEQAVTMGRWAWGSPFVDINNDGWEDLLVANGFVTGPDTHDL